MAREIYMAEAVVTGGRPDGHRRTRDGQLIDVRLTAHGGSVGEA